MTLLYTRVLKCRSAYKQATDLEKVYPDIQQSYYLETGENSLPVLSFCSIYAWGSFKYNLSCSVPQIKILSN